MVSYEDQGTAYDSGAAGHELVGRRTEADDVTWRAEKVRESGHSDYPYAQKVGFDVEVDMYENPGDAEPCYSGSLGALIDINLEATLGDIDAAEIEDLRQAVVDRREVMWGMGFTVLPKGERPASPSPAR